MYRSDIGLGKSGIGDSFARTRLLLAKRAGYLPEGTQIAPGAGASEQWRMASKNLAADARRAGSSNPLLWLRQGAQTGRLQRPGFKGIPGNPGQSLVYANSQLAAQRTAAPPIGGDPMLLLRLLQMRRGF